MFGIIASSRPHGGGLPPASSTQVNRQFDINGWGGKKWGKYCLPDNTGNQYPVIIFFHGTGETGNVEATLTKLDIHGPGHFLNLGTPMEFNHPVTGIPQRFIYLALQDQYWSPEMDWYKYVLQNDAVLAPRVDLNNVFATGLSAGGQQVENGVTQSADNGNLVRGVVPMSSAAWSNNSPSQIAYFSGKPVWGFHGNNGGGSDGTTPTAATTDFVTAFSGRYTNAPPTHSNWNNYYNPTYVETIDGYSMGIFQWMAYKKI